MRKTTKATKESSPERRAKVTGWLFVLGVFLVIHMFLLSQKDLEKPMAPLHLALLGLLGAFLFGALASRVKSLALLGIALASGLLSLGFSFANAQGLVLGTGWFVLIAWSTFAAFRGGP